MRVSRHAKLRLGALLSATALMFVVHSQRANSEPLPPKFVSAVSKQSSIPGKTKQASQSSSAAKKAASETAVSAWKLDQRSRILGDQIVFVCPQGIKAVNRKDGLTILFSAPFTEVVTYSTRTGKICRQTYERSENPYARAVAMFSGVSHGQVPMYKKRDYSKGGMQWTEFAIPEKYKEKSIALWKKNDVTSSEPASGRLIGFHLPVEKRALDWLARLYCVPKTGSIPFDVTFADVDGESHSLVKTFSMVATRLTAADLKCPTGLRAVKDPRAVVQDESSNDAIEMMMSPSRK